MKLVLTRTLILCTGAALSAQVLAGSAPPAERTAFEEPSALADQSDAVRKAVELADRAHAKVMGERAEEYGALAGAVTNDNCANNTPIAGEGTFPFNNAAATQDGGAHQACTDPLDSVGTIGHDVWYCWTASCTGPVRLQTCGQTTVDTKVAVYDGCTCPATNANLLGCNDDGCGTGSFLQSNRVFDATMGQSYLLRIGTYPGDIGDPLDPLDDIPAAPGGVGTFSLTCLTPPCAQPENNCQAIKADAGSLSNRNTSQVADNFTVTASGSITNICWWGSYLSDVTPIADSFRIRYFTNTAQNLPSATAIASFMQGMNLTVNGPVETAVFGSEFPIFEYTATHAAVAVVAGQTYWVEITNVVSGDTWYWQQGFGSDRMSLQDGSKPMAIGDIINGYTAMDAIPNDMAFCAGVPITQAPPNPCGTAPNSCCSASNQPGCNDQTCCETVCACDPFCCQVAWDINCATTGLEGGCGAQALCSGVCAGCPEGAITFTEPDDCTLDAGQPHGLASGTPTQGITQLHFTGPAGADNESCWSVSGGTSVQNIVDNGDGTFTMTLAQPPPTLAETVITYTSDGNMTQSTRLLTHPGNVDGGPATDPNDVVNHRLCCLNQSCTPAHGTYSCDINRSGITTAEDLIRLVDLLNGAGAFNLWNQSQRPASMCP